MKPQEEFIRDIFNKVPKRESSFSFDGKHVIISFKHESDRMSAYQKLKDVYYVIPDEDRLIVINT